MDDALQDQIADTIAEMEKFSAFIGVRKDHLDQQIAEFKSVQDKLTRLAEKEPPKITAKPQREDEAFQEAPPTKRKPKSTRAVAKRKVSTNLRVAVLVQICSAAARMNVDSLSITAKKFAKLNKVTAGQIIAAIEELAADEKFEITKFNEATGEFGLQLKEVPTHAE